MKLAETRCKYNPSGEQTRARSGPRTCSIIAFPLCLSDEHMFTQSLSLLSFCLSSLSLSRARAHSLSETDTSTQCLSLSRSRTQSTHTCTHAKTSSMAPFPERHCLHSSRSRCLTDQLICGVNQQPSLASKRDPDPPFINISPFLFFPHFLTCNRFSFHSR